MLPRVSLVRLLTGNQILELQRTPEDSKPGREWDLPGGHAEAGETPDYTAARELGARAPAEREQRLRELAARH